MSIFDVFTFKKEASGVFTKENFAEVLQFAKEKIVEQAKAKIPGIEKKIAVDNAVIVKIREIRSTCKNKLVLWLIDQIIKVVPTVTQLIYDFLKAKIENL